MLFKFRLMIRVYHDMFGKWFAPHVADAEVKWGGVEEDAYLKLDASTRKILMRGFADEFHKYVDESVSFALLSALSNATRDWKLKKEPPPVAFDLTLDAPVAVTPVPRSKTDPHLCANATVRVKVPPACNNTPACNVTPDAFLRELNHVLGTGGSGWHPRGTGTLGPPRTGRSGVEKRRTIWSNPWDKFGYTIDAQGHARLVPASAMVEVRERTVTVRRRRSLGSSVTRGGASTT